MVPERPTAYYSDGGITLYNGDCLDVLRRLPDDSVDLVLTDPPYNCINRASGGLRVLDKGSADSAPVDIDATVTELVRLCTGSFYVFCGDLFLSDWLRAFKDRGLSVRPGTWEKPNPSPMNGDKMWLSAAEYCAFARKPKAFFSLSCRPNVWRSKVERDVPGHPTPKPLGLMTMLAEASCPPGGTILDPFAGSGTTLVAAARLGMNAIGVEIDPGYCDLTVRRIAQRGFDFGDAA